MKLKKYNYNLSDKINFLKIYMKKEKLFLLNQKNNIKKLVQVYIFFFSLIFIKITYKNKLLKTIFRSQDNLKNIINNDNIFIFKINKNIVYNYFKNNQFNIEYLKLINISYNFSFKFKIIKIEYNIGFYDENNKLVLPSALSLYSNFSIICNAEVENSYSNINSLAYIYLNKYFKYLEFINIFEKIKFGITIYHNDENVKIYKKFFFNEDIINYNNIANINNKIFFPISYNNQYLNLINKINNKKLNETLKLKLSYFKYPYFTLKGNIDSKENIWRFEHIYNYYFCFCKGKACLNSKINQNCKYYFYQYLIDSNINLYPKTDYLFIDFIFNELPSDDVYPVFEEMQKQNLPVHYITEKYNIYQKYCKKEKFCHTIIRVNKNIYYNFGDFLEKYFDLLLKLKAVISAKPKTDFLISNLFYDLKYLAYIAVGHGICYFKDYLYKENRLYGKNINNKLLIPPSNKIISLAKKYGWEDENIIKINPPRWDKYNKILSNTENKNIFMMFTWRQIKKGKKISSHYVNNIKKLLSDERLYKKLESNKITLYISFHRLILNILKNKFNTFFEKKNFLKYIDQNDISNCLCKSSLVVTDFSSIIFDFMYRKKPFILYIPDAYEPNIEKIYYRDYSELIKSMKNGTIIFENTYFSIQETINKIIDYINNNFQLEKKMEKFYESFQFKKGNNIKNFISYLNTHTILL